MKITRNQLRRIIKEELSRLLEDDETIVMDPIEINVDRSELAKISQEDLDYAGVIMNAANEMAPGYSDPLDALAEALLDGSMDLATAQAEAKSMIDLLARLDNAEEIGVIEAAAALGL